LGTAVSLVIGVFWGAIAGILRGRWDAVMMRFVERARFHAVNYI